MARNQDWASLRREATELGHQIRDLGTSYGTEKQRKLLCSRLLKLLGRAYPLPHELTEALAIAGYRPELDAGQTRVWSQGERQVHCGDHG
jgi:hypothetical protein